MGTVVLGLSVIFSVRPPPSPSWPVFWSYEDPSSFYRLCERLAGIPAGELFSERGPEVVLEALARRLTG